LSIVFQRGIPDLREGGEMKPLIQYIQPDELGNHQVNFRMDLETAGISLDELDRMKPIFFCDAT